jgi:hypothetical protein
MTEDTGSSLPIKDWYAHINSGVQINSVFYDWVEFS